MLNFLLIPVFVLLGVAVVGSILYARRRERRARVTEMLAGTNLLAAWTYAPDDWRRAVEEEYTWVKSKNGVGDCYISPTAIYVKNDSQDRLIDLSSEGKVVTHASYRGADSSSPLKLRVRWRVVKQYEDRPDEVKYFKEDYRNLCPFSTKTMPRGLRISLPLNWRITSQLTPRLCPTMNRSACSARILFEGNLHQL